MKATYSVTADDFVKAQRLLHRSAYFRRATRGNRTARIVVMVIAFVGFLVYSFVRSRSEGAPAPEVVGDSPVPGATPTELLVSLLPWLIVLAVGFALFWLLLRWARGRMFRLQEAQLQQRTFEADAQGILWKNAHSEVKMAWSGIQAVLANRKTIALATSPLSIVIVPRHVLKPEEEAELVQLVMNAGVPVEQSV
ncbi:MAG: YcxB family protein [Tepidisphaeraceae bacterium]